MFTNNSFGGIQLFIRKLLLVIGILAAGLSVTLLPQGALASTTTAHDPAWTTLDSFLQDAQDENLAKMLSISTDTRFAGGDVGSQYQSLLAKPSNQLQSYTISSESTVDANDYSFMTLLSFKDGSTADVPFHVVDTSGAWRVFISPDSLATGYKVVQAAPTSSGSGVTSATTPSYTDPGEIATWSYQGLASTLYSIDSFFPNDADYNRVTLHLQQTSDFTPNGIADVQYSVVVRQIWGDDIWGNQISVYGNVWGTPQNYVINGPAYSNPPGCQLRFVNLGNSTGTNTVTGFGSAYNY